jgi:hypothetical protein
MGLRCDLGEYRSRGGSIMSNRDFEIGSRKFKLNKLDAMKQFHIARRVGPILADLLPSMGALKKTVSVADAEGDKLEGLAKALMPIMVGLSKLSDEDSQYVLFGLLASVEVQQSAGNWAKVSTESMLMINDIELPQLLQIAGRAFAYNLGGFTAGLPAS